MSQASAIRVSDKSSHIQAMYLTRQIYVGFRPTSSTVALQNVAQNSDQFGGCQDVSLS